MSQRTVGPWEVCKHGTPAAHPQFGVYAGSANDHVIVKGDNAAADASLIAAAPELLAALERFARAMEQRSYPELQGVASDAFAAIAKAKGQQ